MDTKTFEDNAGRLSSRDRSGLRARLSGLTVEDRPIEAALRRAMAEREQLDAKPRRGRSRR